MGTTIAAGFRGIAQTYRILSQVRRLAARLVTRSTIDRSDTVLINDAIGCGSCSHGVARLKTKLRVVVAVFAEAQILDITGPVAVFTAANRLLPAHLGYEVKLVAERVGRVEMSSPISLMVDGCWASQTDRDLDTLLIAGGMPGTLGATSSRTLRRLILEAHGSQKRVASICTGALTLAAAGILNHRKCTTHWQYTKRLRQDYPAAQVLDDVIFHVDRNVWTSAGVTSGMDMTLAMVAEDFGTDIAQEVAKNLVMFVVRPGAQKQLSDNLLIPMTRNQKFHDLLLWMHSNPCAKLDLVSMADRCNMSTRNFTRLFPEEFGCTPAKMVESARVAAAQYYLQNTNFDLKRIAPLSGFPSPEAMGAAFKRQLDLLPNTYRALGSSVTNPRAGLHK